MSKRAPKRQQVWNDKRFYHVGRKHTPFFETRSTLREVAERFGFPTRQAADYWCCVALGKFVVAAQQRLRKDRPWL